MKKQFILFMLSVNLSQLSWAMEMDVKTENHEQIKPINIEEEKTEYFRNI